MAVFNCFQGELQEEQDQSYEGGLKVLKLLLEGVSEALPPEQGLSRLSKQLSPLIYALEKVILTLGPNQCFHIIEILAFVNILENRLEELENLTELARFAVNIIRLCIRAEAFGNLDVADKANKVILSVFSIAKENSSIFVVILEELSNENVEKWHSYDENVIFY